MKYILPIFCIIYAGCSNNYETASPVIVETDTISKATLELGDSLSASIHALDSLKPVVEQTVQQLKDYKEIEVSKDYNKPKIVYKPVTDSSAIYSLQSKLTAANNEISKLKGDIASIQSKRNASPVKDTYSSWVQSAIVVPDENSIIVNVDGRSKRGDIPTDNLTVYLIPYSKRNKRLMNYDSACNELYAEAANYYNGVYFFNNVKPGKYIIKICTYFGNYKLINKEPGKYNMTMQVSPPLQ